MASIRTFPKIRKFEDIPGNIKDIYFEDPISRSSPTAGIVCSDLRDLVGLPLARLRVTVQNFQFPSDELEVCHLTIDWLRANCCKQTISAYSDSDIDRMSYVPAQGILTSARKNAIRRLFFAFRSRAEKDQRR
jgi:hypothetical protein